MKTKPAITVYYNTACPVCDAGIRSQRGRMADCQVEWIDVHQDSGAATQLGVDLEAVRERLHVRGDDGKLHVGSDAMIELLVRTPRWRALGWLSRRLDFVLRPLYDAFARQLYRWNRRRGHW